MMHRLITFSLIVSGLLAACAEATEYSPNQIFDKDSPRDLNRKNLDKLLATGNDDTLSIAFIGDSQRFYEEIELFAKKVNTLEGIDFVIIAGDLSEFGLLAEFEWVADRLKELNMPYITAIGNHDVVANGEEVYKRMFGPLNFAFTYDSIKFLFHNTNSREFPGGQVPDLDWLSAGLQGDPAVKSFIAVSHVPPFDGDFNAALEQPYRQLFRDTPGFLLSLHGHLHRHTDGYPYQDDVRYITGHFFGEREFLRLDISKATVVTTIIEF